MADGDGTVLTTDTGTPGAEGTDTTPIGDGNSFLNSLPETLRGHEAFSTFENVEQMAQKHLETIGKVPVVPETPDAYQIAVPEGMQLDDARVKDFMAFAHANGFTQDQVNKVIEYQATHQKGVSEKAAQAKLDRQTKVTQAYEKNMNDLKTDWGNQFDGNLESAKTALRKFGDEKFVEFVNQSKLGDNPSFIKFMHGIGKSISEDSFMDGKPGSPTPEAKRTAAGNRELSFPNTPEHR